MIPTRVQKSSKMNPQIDPEPLKMMPANVGSKSTKTKCKITPWRQKGPKRRGFPFSGLWGVYTLRVYILGVCSLGLPILDLAKH